MEPNDVKAIAKAFEALVEKECEVRVTLRIHTPAPVGQALVNLPVSTTGKVVDVSEDGRAFTMRGLWGGDARTQRMGEQAMLVSDVAYWTILGDVALAPTSIVRPS